MNSFILCTVGTSLLARIRRERGLGAADKPDYREILDELNRLSSNDRNCGAEINSLDSLFAKGKVGSQRIDPPYSLVFLASDTPDGEWTGRLLQAYWESGKRGIKIESAAYETVEGLQPGDPNLFAREGLRNLVKLSCKHLGEHAGKSRVINATGGYKAQISFAGLIGQTIGVPVIYLFETFPFCIEMPPMPVDFSRDLWLEHYDLFIRMSEDSIYGDDPLLEDTSPVFIELLDRIEENGSFLYELSPILELMHQGFMMRPWQKEVRQPKDSGLSAGAKWRVNEAELSHAPNGSREFIKKLCELPWTTSAGNVKLADTRRSRVISRQDPEKQDEIQLYFADGEKALVIALRTTCVDDGERDWCLKELTGILNR